MKQLSVFTFFLAFTLFISSSEATNCICRVVPMYPVPGGWMNYAVVCETSSMGCIFKYPTGFIGDPISGEACNDPDSCFNCLTLSSFQPPEVNLYYKTENGLPLSALELNTTESFLRKLEELSPTPGGYAGAKVSIRQPFPSLYTKPVLVQFVEKTETEEKTHFAIVWRVVSDTKQTYSHIGLQVADPGADKPKFSVIRGTDAKNATTTIRNEEQIVSNPVPGLMQIRISNSTNPKDVDYAFIRMVAPAE